MNVKFNKCLHERLTRFSFFLQSGVPAFTVEQEESALQVLKERAREINVSLYQVNPNPQIFYPQCIFYLHKLNKIYLLCRFFYKLLQS